MKRDYIFRSLKKMQDEINSIMTGNMMDTEHGMGFNYGSMVMQFPETDIKDTGDMLIITMDIPGVNKEDIKIRMDEDWLEVNAKREVEKTKENEGYFVSERNYRGFYRKIALPEQVIPEKTKAKYHNGVLGIIAPKAESVKAGIDVE